MTFARRIRAYPGAPIFASAALLASLAADARAAPPSPTDDFARGEIELRAAEADNSTIERNRHAANALAHFEASFGAEPSWKAAAGASGANLLLGSSAAASGWYWIASDNADYSEPYLAWQKGALAEIFDGRAAFTLEYNEIAATVRVDGVGLPAGAFDRPVALDVGTHSVLATAESGNTFQGTLEVDDTHVGGRHFFPVRFVRVLKAGEEDPLMPLSRGRPKPDTSMAPLQIAMVVGTVALASGIAIGGGYLLFGEDNPRGIDTPEGAAVIITELIVIGAGTAIALLSDA